MRKFMKVLSIFALVCTMFAFIPLKKHNPTPPPDYQVTVNPLVKAYIAAEQTLHQLVVTKASSFKITEAFQEFKTARANVSREQLQEYYKKLIPNCKMNCAIAHAWAIYNCNPVDPTVYLLCVIRADEAYDTCKQWCDVYAPE